MTKRIFGHQLAGILINGNKAAIQVTLNHLEAVGLKSPYAMARTPLTKTDETDIKAKELREVLQRAWDKSRGHRADLYAEYLRNIFLGKINGSAPPPTLYTPANVSEIGDGEVSLPFQAGIIAIDGETQLEARFRLRREVPETGDDPFAAIVHFGIDADFAMQILHDYNRYANPIPEAKLGARNSSGGISATVNQALELAGFPSNVLNVSGATGNNKLIAGFAQAMHFVAGCALGAQGLKVDKLAGYFDELNRPGAPPINGNCPQELAAMFTMAAQAPDGMPFRKLASLGWQVAGVLVAEGRKVNALNWAQAFATDRSMRRKGRGGPTVKSADRRQRFYDALTSEEAVAAA
jgi:hypothetical protein